MRIEGKQGLNTGVIWESFQSIGRDPLAREEFITRKSGGAREVQKLEVILVKYHPDLVPYED